MGYLRLFTIFLLIEFLFSAPVLAQESAAADSAELESQHAEVNSVPEKAPIPFKTQSDVSGDMIIKIMFVLVVLLVLAAIGLYLAKRLMLPAKNSLGSDRSIHVLEVRRLSPKTTVYLIGFENRRLLLAQTGDSTVVLDRIIDDGSSTEPVREL